MGPKSLIDVARGTFARISLAERLAVDARALDVVMTRGSQTRRVELALPEPAVSARLLRDPFEQARASKVRQGAIASQLLLSQNARWLLYRNAKAELLVQAIPNSPAARYAPARRYMPKPESIIACVGRKGRNLVWLAQRGAEISVGFADHTQRPKHALRVDGPPLSADRLTTMAWFPEEKGAVFEADDRSLWRADFAAERCRKIAEGVRSWVTVEQRTLVAVDRWLKDDMAPQPRVIELHANEERSLFEVPSWHDARLIHSLRSRLWVTLAYAEDRLWQLLPLELGEGALTRSKMMLMSSTSVNAPSGTTVLGAEAFTTPKQLPGLWVLEANRRGVSIVRRQGSPDVFRSLSEIESAAFSGTERVVALLTKAGQLSVINARGQVLYQADVET